MMIGFATLFASVLTAAQLVSAQSGLYQQCGGQRWNGPTSCVAGATCLKLGSYYSQCVPDSVEAAASSSAWASATATNTGSAPPAASSGALSGLPRLKGVNNAGYDFSVYTNGSFSGTGVDPPVAQFTHFAEQGVNTFRIPFAWQLMTPTVGGNIDETFFKRYDATVQAALATGAFVILDLHNYARWNGQIINQGGPTTEQYASVWSQIAKKYATNEKIIFGIMNEPHDLPAIPPWVEAVQAAVNAIRAAGATSQVILIPGSSWSSAAALPTEAGPLLLGVTDPNGDTSKIVFDVHKYLDSDNSGTHDDCTTDNKDVFVALIAWLNKNGRQAVLSETGGGHTESCYTAFKTQLAQIKDGYPAMLGFTVWSAGSFNTEYTLSVTPNPDGTDLELWTRAVIPNL